MSGTPLMIKTCACFLGGGLDGGRYRLGVFRRAPYIAVVALKPTSAAPAPCRRSLPASLVPSKSCEASLLRYRRRASGLLRRGEMTECGRNSAYLQQYCQNVERATCLVWYFMSALV
jgi:hypothetical protein